MVYRLSKIVQILFQRVSIERLLTEDGNKKIYCNDLSVMYLQDLMLTYYSELSDTEVELQISEIQAQISKMESGYMHAGKGFDVFSVLFSYVPEVLDGCRNEIVCKYHKLLEWNELAKAIGEDLLVLSMRVLLDIRQGIECGNFAWPPVIGHNNSNLNRILDKGFADNHFHLRGSSSHFEISWLNLMNRPARPEIKKYFEKIEKNQRDKVKKAEIGVMKQPYWIINMQAALIRLYLCNRLRDLENREIVLSQDYSLTVCTLERLLENYSELQIISEIIQRKINVISGNFATKDYMLLFAPTVCNEEEEKYRILTGERWFIYQMLKEIRTGSRFSNMEVNFFYAYLRIKNEIRSELVQVNDLAGFQNFRVYQDRKDYFTHYQDSWWKNEEEVVRLAVKDVLNNPAAQYLELRISPGDTAEENMEYILRYDEAVIKPYYKDELLEYELNKIRREEEKKRFYYVFHFTKQKDDFSEDILIHSHRHQQYRKRLKQKVEAILVFRKKYPRLGCRVLGIDACAMEIGCRPEVFASVFRKLKNVSYVTYNSLYDIKVPQLRLTYHVGEDFLDVIDGLRAIDEAVRFLGMDCGDRLGHALALGIDVKKWYIFKNMQITLKLQDYLDNIVWMHHALSKYNIQHISSLKGWLLEQYTLYFQYIYASVSEKIKGHFIGSYDINIYYYSWLLRGDDPELYQYRDGEIAYTGVDPVNPYGVNKERQRSDDIRNIPEVVRLYYMYHYNEEVKLRGQEKKTISLSDKYVEGVMLIQKALCEEIVVRGIGIESNPTSNVKIGTFKSYSEHPIKTFYNLGLTYNEKEIMECPQMNVSINTDDKGIFSTRIENEYALMASALENELLEDGKRHYKRECIYEWLDRIREMGLRQAFGNDSSKN